MITINKWHSKRVPQLLFILLAGYLLTRSAPVAHAYLVPELPADNLIVNPWFRSAHNPGRPGLDGWTNISSEGSLGWEVVGADDRTPSPDTLVRPCNPDQICGTSIRWANSSTREGVVSHPNIDVYLSQVVEANSANRKLKYFMHWVNHKVDVVEVKVYGSNSANGAWQEVWTPFYLVQDVNPSRDRVGGHGDNPWYETGFLETTLGQGYPFYKVELHARYPDAETSFGDVGVKISGVYFAAEFTTEPENLSPPLTLINTAPTAVTPTTTEEQQVAPTVSRRITPEAEASATPQAEEATATPTRERTPTPTNTPLPVSSPTAVISPTPQAPDPVDERRFTPSLIIGLSAAGIILLWLIFKLTRKK